MQGPQLPNVGDIVLRTPVQSFANSAGGIWFDPYTLGLPMAQTVTTQYPFYRLKYNNTGNKLLTALGDIYDDFNNVHITNLEY